MAASTVTAMAGTVVVSPAAFLSSGNAFRSSSLVQLAPIKSKKVEQLVVARATLSEESPKTARREVLASILAAGAALAFAGDAFANPLSAAKSKADQVVSKVKDSAPKLPNEVQDAADNAASGLKSRIDGIVGKNKPGPPLPGRVASTNGGTGSAIGDAKKRVSNFGKNPFAENLEKASKDADNVVASASGENSGSARAGREFLGQDSTRVNEATRKVNSLGSDLKKKSSDALNEGKNLVGQAQNATPNLPDLPSPPSPSLPDLPLPKTGGLFKGLKENVGSKVDDAKEAVGGVLQ